MRQLIVRVKAQRFFDLFHVPDINRIFTENSMNFKNSVGATALAGVLVCGALGIGSAQAAPAEKAQGGIAGYLSIVSISKMCKFNIDPAIRDAVTANINALQPVSKWSDKDIDNALKTVDDQLASSKDKLCGPGIDVFYSKLKDFEKIATTEADGSGVTLKPLPAPASAKAKDPKDAAFEQLNLAIMLEAVSDECSIKLKDGESLKIDRVEYYWRGKADYSAKQFADLQKFWEDKTKAEHAKVCAKDFGFRAAFEESLKTID
jgi:hypothetical protein